MDVIKLDVRVCTELIWHVMGTVGNGNETSECHKGGKFLDQLSDY
jgi:hypothetical protein